MGGAVRPLPLIRQGAWLAGLNVEVFCLIWWHNHPFNPAAWADMRNPFSDNTSLKIPALDKINAIGLLKSLGPYRDIKYAIEKKLGIPLKANSWEQLFEKINQLSLAVDSNMGLLTLFLADNKQLRAIGPFFEAKKRVSELLALPIKARGWEQLESNLKRIVLAVSHREITDKAALFEKYKIHNFIHSSRLEGIYMNDAPALKMEEVLDKYRVK